MTEDSKTMSRRTKIFAALGSCGLLLVGGSAMAEARGWVPRPTEVRVMLNDGNSNPLFSDGVATGKNVPLYISAGLGPSPLNLDAPAGTPERYTDPALTGDVAGVTITEAQALVMLRNMEDNLRAAGLSPKDVITLDCYLVAPPGEETPDYAGWNRAYRQYFSNIDLHTHEVLKVPMGSTDPAPPLVPNATRPARVTLEVPSLAGPGWLVEIQVTAAYRTR
jgi:enamine deaminase RidA (YjgF/YER057c/UK114 family)